MAHQTDRLPLPGAQAGDRWGLTDRREAARFLALLLFGLGAVSLVASMLAQTGGNDGVLSAWQQLLLAIVALSVLGLAVGAGIPLLNWLLAGALALAGLLPNLLALVRDQPLELNLLVFGLVAAALSVGAALGPPGLWRGGVLAVLTVIVWASFLAAILATFDVGVDVFYRRNEREFLGLSQVKGIAGHPNTLALIAVLALVLQIQSIRRLARNRDNVPYPELASSGMRVVYFVFGPIVSLVVLFATQSRTGWLVACCALVAVLLPLPSGRSRNWWATGMLTFFVLLAQVPMIAPELMGSAHPSLGAGSGFNGRSFAWSKAWEEFLANPILGRGTEAFSQQYWAADTFSNPWEPGHAHNQVLQAGMTGGLLALVVLLLLFAILAYIAVRAFDADSRWLMGVLVTLVVTSSVEVVLGVGTVSATFVVPLLLPVVATTSAVLMTKAAVRLDR